MPSRRLKANLSKERGESIKLLSKTETHKSRNKSLARDWRCIAMLQLGVNWLISNHIVREAVVILQRSYLTPTISSPVQLITRKKWTSHWVVVWKQSNYLSVDFSIQGNITCFEVFTLRKLDFLNVMLVQYSNSSRFF